MKCFSEGSAVSLVVEYRTAFRAGANTVGTPGQNFGEHFLKARFRGVEVRIGLGYKELRDEAALVAREGREDISGSSQATP